MPSRGARHQGDGILVDFFENVTRRPLLDLFDACKRTGDTLHVANQGNATAFERQFEAHMPDVDAVAQHVALQERSDVVTAKASVMSNLREYSRDRAVRMRLRRSWTRSSSSGRSSRMSSLFCRLCPTPRKGGLAVSSAPLSPADRDVHPRQARVQNWHARTVYGHARRWSIVSCFTAAPFSAWWPTPASVLVAHDPLAVVAVDGLATAFDELWVASFPDPAGGIGAGHAHYEPMDWQYEPVNRAARREFDELVEARAHMGLAALQASPLSSESPQPPSQQQSLSSQQPQPPWRQPPPPSQQPPSQSQQPQPPSQLPWPPSQRRSRPRSSRALPRSSSRRPRSSRSRPRCSRAPASRACTQKPRRATSSNPVPRLSSCDIRRERSARLRWNAWRPQSTPVDRRTRAPCSRRRRRTTPPRCWSLTHSPLALSCRRKSASCS